MKASSVRKAEGSEFGLLHLMALSVIAVVGWNDRCSWRSLTPGVKVWRET
jgi:hypothetical protein